MRVGFLRAFAFLCLFASLVFGQGATATITGTVTDPSGLPVAGATVQAMSAETGAMYSAGSTATGNYAIPNLPVGMYTLTVMSPGFKTYTHTNLALAATQVLREDVTLQVGATTESVTVAAEASMLKTESGELSQNVTLQQMQDLPMLGIGTVNSGTSGYRNPYNTLMTLPGVGTFTTSGTFNVNGLGGPNPTAAPGGSPFSVALTETMRIDGLDATSRIFGNYDYTQIAQPNADALQEISYQTSNYAPEFGQAGSVVVNMTTKSGTNQFHGSAFEYFVNEDLNAGDPFTVNTNGVGKVRPLNRRNDFGGTLGGPVIIPRLYNGKDKTFFFFSYEEYLENSNYQFTDTVPTAAYRAGDFSAISPNGTCALCAAAGIPLTPLGGTQLDALGRPMYANEIYDPASRGIAPNGLGFANPFVNNTIPAARFNATSLAFQSLFPAAQNANLVGNYNGTIRGGRYSAIPTIKVDQIISPKDKLSVYYSKNNTESQIGYPLGNADGLPEEIGGYRGTFIPTQTWRVNYDRTLSPTLLLHLGAGYMHTSFSDRAPFLNFNPAQFGLTNFIQGRQFPSVTGMCGQLSGPPGTPSGCIIGAQLYAGQAFSGFGGMQNIGTSGQTQSLNFEEKPSFNANLTWVKGNHTFKTGAEMYLEQTYAGAYSGVTMAVNNAQGIPAATAQPFINTTSFNGFTQGFGYASFLLGDFASTTQTPNIFTREGSQSWGLFLQDSWKVTRKLTLDYGVRWDLFTPEHEQYNRLGQLDPTLPNPNAGGFPGAVRYANTCNCNFYKSAYPYGLGPRLGIAYQITPKTVFRGGWGVNYQFIASPAGATVSRPGINSPIGVNPYVNISAPGSIAVPAWPVTNPYVYPAPGSFPGVPGNVPYVPDPNENRPPRITNYSAGFQREFTNNLVLEASYVGNHAVWLSGGTGPLAYLSQISPQKFASYGLFPYPGTGPCGTGGGICRSTTYNNLGDYQLLLQPIGAPGVIGAMTAKGHPNLVPYAGFPTTSTLLSSLYTYPQFGNLLDTTSPTGDSKYDSLQVKLTKRFSHGLQLGASFTWAQGFVTPPRQDFFNPQSAVWELQNIPPLQLNLNAIYEIPQFKILPKGVKQFVGGWQVGWYSNYQSGLMLQPPTSPTFNYLPGEDMRVAGQPLYTPGVSINDIGTYSPYTTQVLNPKAWAACSPNAVCPAQSVFYKDFRAPWVPLEQANIGRHFRFGPDARFDLYVRAEFVNIFNRTLMPAPSTQNPQNPVFRNSSGILQGGFGVVNTYLAPGTYYQSGVTGTAPYLQGRTGTLIARFSF